MTYFRYCYSKFSDLCFSYRTWSYNQYNLQNPWYTIYDIHQDLHVSVPKMYKPTCWLIHLCDNDLLKMAFGCWNFQEFIIKCTFWKFIDRTKVIKVWQTLANEQLDAKFLYFIIRLLQSFTCFKLPRTHHQEVKLY